jgi:hypothetical protein
MTPECDYTPAEAQKIIVGLRRAVDDLQKQYDALRSELKPGPTGEFSQGKLNVDDEGDLVVALSSENGNVRIDFGKRVAWVAFPPDMAIEFASTIIMRAREIIET